MHWGRYNHLLRTSLTWAHQDPLKYLEEQEWRQWWSWLRTDQGHRLSNTSCPPALILPLLKRNACTPWRSTLVTGPRIFSNVWINLFVFYHDCLFNWLSEYMSIRPARSSVARASAPKIMIHTQRGEIQRKLLPNIATKDSKELPKISNKVYNLKQWLTDSAKFSRLDFMHPKLSREPRIILNSVSSHIHWLHATLPGFYVGLHICSHAFYWASSPELLC